MLRQKPPPGLRPNCLLTRYPIVFVHGLKSFFNFANYWHGIPEYLAAHGYQAVPLKLPWRGPNTKRVQALDAMLKPLIHKHGRVHLMAHSLGTLNCLELASIYQKEGRSNGLASLTLISPPLRGSPWADLGLKLRWGAIDPFRSTNETLSETAATALVKTLQLPKHLWIGAVLANPTPDTHRSPLVSLQHRLLTRYLKGLGQDPRNDGLVPWASQIAGLNLGALISEFPGDHIQVIGGGPWPKNQKTAHEFYLDHSIFLAERDFVQSN